MSPAKLSRREARMAMIAVAVAELEDRGTCWDAWARERGLPRQAVINVRKGDRPCWTGDSRRAADLILTEARRPGAILGAPRRLVEAEADICRQRMALSACEQALAFARERMADTARIDRALDLTRRALKGEAA